MTQDWELMQDTFAYLRRRISLACFFTYILISKVKGWRMHKYVPVIILVSIVILLAYVGLYSLDK